MLTTPSVVAIGTRLFPKCGLEALGEMGRKAKAKAEPSAAVFKKIKAAAEAAAHVDTLNGGASVNAALQSHLSLCDQKILDSYGLGLVSGSPTASSGTPAYNANAATAALGRGDPYTASCPLFWLKLGYELQPAVPRYQSRITALQEHFFSEPEYFPDPVKVFVNRGELPHEMKGNLRACDPPEMRDALRQAVANAVESGAPNSVLNKWHEVLMSVVFHFEAWPRSRYFDSS